jgi:Putative beta-barrel porin 2
MSEIGNPQSSGLLLGRFLFRPMGEFSWIHGDNLTLQTNDKFADNAIYARGLVAFELLESDNTLNFSYQVRYRDFEKFQLLRERLAHGFDVDAGIHVSPTMTFTAKNHFFRGSFETTEFDPGQEVFFNVEPFNRNQTEAGLSMDLNDRAGVSLRGIYDFVRFQDAETVFFDYQTITAGASFFYRRSPLSSIFGEYLRSITPEPAGRPEAESITNTANVGLQGELSPLLTGMVRAGYSWQEFGQGSNQLEYRGFVASASLTRYFTEAASLTIEGGRQTNLSNYEDNNYYLTNYVSVQYTGPVRRNLQLVAGGSLFDNRYPLESIESPEKRNDNALAGWIGAAYFFTPLTYFRADYRYERRQSNLDQFQYSNNVLRVIVGVGFFSK